MSTTRDAPEHPGELTKRSWWETVKRTGKEFQDDNLTDRAAALTYYALLALFPAMLVLIALLGLIGQYPKTTDSLFKILTDAGASKSTIDTVRKPIEGVVRSKGGAGALLGVGLIGAIWSASGYVGAFMRAGNEVYEVKEGRPFWKLRPLQVVLTVAGVFLVALVLIGIVVSGPLAKSIGDQVGLGSTAVKVWGIAKWPVLLAIAMLLIAVLYYMAPNIRQPRFRWITMGGVLAVVLWMLATAGFFFYVRNFGSYNKTYGTLGGMIVLLLWLWITNLALLFGLEFDSELERSREMQAGVPHEETIALPPRQAPKGQEPVHEDAPRSGEPAERTVEQPPAQGAQDAERTVEQPPAQGADDAERSGRPR